MIIWQWHEDLRGAPEAAHRSEEGGPAEAERALRADPRGVHVDARERVLLGRALPGDAPHTYAKWAGSVGKEFGDISAKLTRQNKQVICRDLGLPSFNTGHRGFGNATKVGNFGQCHPSRTAKV